MSQHSIRFFDNQFATQVANADFALNPFEQRVLPHLRGDVLDLGSGLGNLALAAARRGCRVTALDASPNAIARIRAEAADTGLAITAEVADLRHYRIERPYDSIVCIGLLMFFQETQALALLDAIHAGLPPGGIAALNVLTVGTTYLGMFEPGHFHLFEPGALAERFGDWDVLEATHETFPAPGDTLKAFDTLVVTRPAAMSGRE
jgi:tellurite methyltransferase